MTPSAPNRIVLPLTLLGGIIAVSTASIFIRYAQQEAPSLIIAALRLTLASLILAPLAFFRYRSQLRALTPAELALALLSGFFLALHFATWISSLEYTTVASSVVLVTTTPLWVALLAPLALREPITRAALAGMVLALLGGGLVGISDACNLTNGFTCPPLNEFLGSGSLWGNFLALSGAWMAAGYILIGRRLRAKMALIPYIFVVYGMAALVLLTIAILFGQSFNGYTTNTYFFILLLAVVPQLLGHSTFNWALAYLPASFVSITLLGEPIGSTILAFLILQETPTPLNLLGGALILLGIFIASRQKNAKSMEDAEL